MLQLYARGSLGASFATSYSAYTGPSPGCAARLGAPFGATREVLPGAVHTPPLARRPQAWGDSSIMGSVSAAVKWVGAAVWAMIALTALACFDSIPDPSAITPQVAQSKTVCARNQLDCASSQQVVCEVSCSAEKIVGLLQAHVREPNRSSDWIALAGATDPSPPAFGPVRGL